MENPKVKYGVNCFGKQPDITQDEVMLLCNTTPYPKTEKYIAMGKRVACWRSKLRDIFVCYVIFIHLCSISNY